MKLTLDRHPVRVAVDGDKSEQGYLIFADGVLVAVLSHLKETVDGDFGIAGMWKPASVPVTGSCRRQSSTARKRQSAGWCPDSNTASLELSRGVRPVKKTEDYLKHAKECRALAKQMESGQQREQ